jgi:hypothetical protein
MGALRWSGVVFRRDRRVCVAQIVQPLIAAQCSRRGLGTLRAGRLPPWPPSAAAALRKRPARLRRAAQPLRGAVLRDPPARRGRRPPLRRQVIRQATAQLSRPARPDREAARFTAWANGCSQVGRGGYVGADATHRRLTALRSCSRLEEMQNDGASGGIRGVGALGCGHPSPVR